MMQEPLSPSTLSIGGPSVREAGHPIVDSPSGGRGTAALTPAPRARRSGLHALFDPRSIAVIGASEQIGSVGRVLIQNLAGGGFAGPVWPVNIKGTPVFGRETFTDVSKLPDVPDLAVIATPARTVEKLIGDCGRIGIPATIVLSAGVRELAIDSELGQTAGPDIDSRIRDSARSYGMRVVGPNCLGVMSPAARMNATFAPAIAKPGRVAFLSQSGALCTAILDWGLGEEVGFRAIVSLGDMCDVGWGDAIDHFGQDLGTDVILCYVESVGEARSFLAAVRRVALAKPVVVLKGGRTQEAAQAVCSHTGALAGNELVFETAMRRAGAIQVHDLESLLAMAEVLSKQPRAQVGRLAILTNAGGPAVLATDALTQAGGKLASLSLKTLARLDAILPSHCSRGNPVDLGGDSPPQRFEWALDCLLAAPECDGILMIQTPQAMTEPLETARLLAPRLARCRKTAMVSWMGGPAVVSAELLFNAASVPTFEFPETAARVFGHLSRHAEDLRHLYEPPRNLPTLSGAGARIDVVESIVAGARTEGRTLLNQDECRRVLAAYHIPVVAMEIAVTEEDAVAEAGRLGFPVVLKLHSRTATHKSELEGVRLHLGSEEQVRQAFRGIAESARRLAGPDAFDGVAVQPMVTLPASYELILGSSYDEQFGPVLLFGSGGTLVEVTQDRAMELPPLSTTLARRLIERTRIAEALKGVRGRRPVDLNRLDQILVSFGDLIGEHPAIRECDINPLLASPETIVSLDARIVLHAAGSSSRLVPAAIRPYPREYVRTAVLREGTAVVIRPIRPEDEPEIAKLQAAMSDEAIHQRYFEQISLARRTEHHRLVQACLTDFECEISLVAQLGDSPEIVGLANLSRGRNESTADFGVLVAGDWQNKGVGRMLLELLIDVGKREGVRRIEGPLLADNFAMSQLCRDLGFRVETDLTGHEVTASLDLLDEPDHI